MRSGPTTRLWTLSDDPQEYARYKSLLDGSLKSVLDAPKIRAALREHGLAAFGASARLILLHDPCDIRKPHSARLEKIGTVRSLTGDLILGYQTFNSVALDESANRLRLLDISVFSNGDERYVTQKERDAHRRGVLVKNNPARAEIVETHLTAGDDIAFQAIFQDQLRRISTAFKAQQPGIKLCHVLDRQFDGAPYFEFIGGELQDEFVIRLKASRNDPGETGGKLMTRKFACGSTLFFEKISFKSKAYQGVSGDLEWDNVTLGGQTYALVRIRLRDAKGQPIFKNPMLLLTNLPIETAEQALAVYRTYFKRAKIEAVFKFLKETLGWEDFQIRDFEAIQNLIAFAFFIGAYFYEIESKIALNPILILICRLGGGKGKMTRHFLHKGLQALIIAESVQNFREKNHIDDATFRQMLAVANGRT